MKNTNEMELIFDSQSVNEGFARVSVAAFMTQLNPTLEEVADVKTAVSEAVTNAIIHGYEKEIDKIRIRCRLKEQVMEKELRMWSRPCNHCLHQSRNLNDLVWAFLLWKHLWMRFLWNLNLDRGL